MPTEVLTKDELFASIDETVSQLVQLMSSLDEEQVNKVPYEGSWTAGQLVRHVTKSSNGMGAVMSAPAKQADRNPAEKVDGLRTTFLDFNLKMQSPDFIVPEDQVYDKQQSIDELQSAFEKMKTGSANASLDELVEGLPFGPTTKLELLHFVLFHTQRHLHQMKKICGALKH